MSTVLKVPKVTLDDLAVMIKVGFDSVDKRFIEVDKRFDRLEAKFDHLEQAVVKDHAPRLRRIERKLQIA